MPSIEIVLRAVAAARRMVDDDADRRVGQIELPGQRGFRHAGHADQRRAVALQPVDLGGGFQPRPVDGAVDAAVAQREAGGSRRSEAALRAGRGVYGWVKSTWTTLRSPPSKNVASRPDV